MTTICGNGLAFRSTAGDDAPVITIRARDRSGRGVRRRVAVVLIALGPVACGTGASIELAEDRRDPNSPLLVERIESGSPAERARAALAMGRIQADGYAAPLARAASDPDEQVRLAALFALGQLGLADGARADPVAVAAALTALADPDARIVAAATEALGKLAHAAAAAAITPQLGHPSSEVRAAAAHALFRLRFVPLWRGESEAPPELPAVSVVSLIARLEDESPDVRQAVAHAFSRYGEPEAVPALELVLDDEDEWVRLFAARALGRSGPHERTEALIVAAGDPSPRVRAEAVAALAALGAIDRAPITALLRDESFHVRAALARGLGESPRDETLASLAILEEDPSPTVAAEAIVASAVRRRERYAELLAPRLRDERWMIRVAAARAAVRVGEPGTALVEQALQDEDGRVRVAALEGLAAMPGRLDRIFDALRAPDLAERGTAVELVAAADAPDKLERLVAAYRDSAGVEWVEVRESIAGALAEIDGAQTALEEIAGGDPARAVRVAARRALERRGIAQTTASEPGVAEPSPWLGARLARDPVVVLETSKGRIEIRCLAEDAPIHVASFLERVREGFYDGRIWHRVVTNFVIQGGDLRGDGWGGAGYLLRDEIHPGSYSRGAVGMPKAGKDTGGAQIFISQIPTPHLDGNYTLFGRVVSGIDVVDRIEVGDRIERARVRQDH